MARFMMPLTALLATSFTATIVHGMNLCITGSSTRCRPGFGLLNLRGCNIRDVDASDLKTCFDTRGRASITTLDLEDNALIIVTADLFVNMSSLEFLILTDGGITTIEPGSFQDLGALTNLQLGRNNLETLPTNVFDGLTVLNQLNLQANRFITLEDGTFAGLMALTILDLDFNDLETLPVNLFAGLTSLDLLDLRLNKINALEVGLFEDLVALTMLELDDNLLESVPSNVFANLAALETLYLDRNNILTIQTGSFAGLSALTVLHLDQNLLEILPADLFTGMISLQNLGLSSNNIRSIDVDAFATLNALEELDLASNLLASFEGNVLAGKSVLKSLHLDANLLDDIPAKIFTDLTSLQDLSLSENGIRSINVDAFATLGDLNYLDLESNQLDTLQGNTFAGTPILQSLNISSNALNRLPVNAFTGLSVLEELKLGNNALTTLPAGLFDGVGSGSSLQTLDLGDNSELQCVPTNTANDVVSTAGTTCGCTPAEAVSCDEGESCAAGTAGYTCAVVAPPCMDDSDCDTIGGEVCCPETNVCEDPNDVNAGACGDPHMTGFRGQKFDFTGKDAGWYAVVSDLPHMHLNMRITSPVPSVPEITYITGISIVTRDTDGLDHTIVISVAEPHNIESSCPVGVSPCLADGALHTVVNGQEVLVSPGEVSVAPGISIATVNLPGACRSFGFETYWERKKLERLTQSGRKLGSTATMQDMSDWIISDPTATNIVECEEYVASVTASDVNGVFAHQSEHASFQIMTPKATIRLSHGRLHQLPTRDPTDQFDLPDHLAWQMNMAIDHSNMGFDATGVLGETLVPTVDDNGAPIMQGIDAIRGHQEDYRVEGPLGVAFAQGQHHE